QQSLAKKGSVLTPADPAQLMENALTMQGGALSRHEVEVIRRFENLGEIPLDTHKILQILINLISNAKHAVKASNRMPRRITLVVTKSRVAEAHRVRFSVIDNGIGIARENLTRI